MNSRARPDHWTIKAKKLGYPARSVFKLEEIHHKWKVLQRGKSVLDVGAAPGSWSLYALRNLGAGARVTAVDLKPLSIRIPSGAVLNFLQGNVFSDAAEEFLRNHGPYGCLLSDAAPDTSGNRLTDARKSYELAMRVIDLTLNHISKNGNLVVKVFQGGDEGAIRARLKELFKDTRVFKPRAVRSESVEIYMIGLGSL